MYADEIYLNKNNELIKIIIKCAEYENCENAVTQSINRILAPSLYFFLLNIKFSTK